MTLVKLLVSSLVVVPLLFSCSQNEKKKSQILLLALLSANNNTSDGPTLSSSGKAPTSKTPLDVRKITAYEGSPDKIRNFTGCNSHENVAVAFRCRFLSSWCFEYDIAEFNICTNSDSLSCPLRVEGGSDSPTAAPSGPDNLGDFLNCVQQNLCLKSATWKTKHENICTKLSVKNVTTGNDTRLGQSTEEYPYSSVLKLIVNGGQGTGTLIAPQWIVTNFHVIAGLKKQWTAPEEDTKKEANLKPNYLIFKGPFTLLARHMPYNKGILTQTFTISEIIVDAAQKEATSKRLDMTKDYALLKISEISYQSLIRSTNSSTPDGLEEIRLTDSGSIKQHVESYFGYVGMRLFKNGPPQKYFDGKTYWLAGYSADLPWGLLGVDKNCNLSRRPPALNNNLTENLAHTCNMTRGASGSSILLNENSSFYSVALNNAEDRHGGETSLYTASGSTNFAVNSAHYYDAIKDFVCKPELGGVTCNELVP